MAPARSAWRRGSRIGARYRLEARIGTGGNAEFWRAHDDRLDRSVAVKLLRPDVLPDAGSRYRLVAEARATAALAHPGIVPVFDVVEDDDAIAIVFQLIEGTSLAERLRRDGPLPQDPARRVAIEIAAALEHAHRAGLVHLDVKPANVVLDDDGHARLVDFGIARLLDAAAPRSRRRRRVSGTLRHMAPEQLAGEAVDGRTDLYALGLLLVEMLTGRPAFDARNPAALLAAERAGPPSLDGIGAELRALLGRLLAPEPSDRPASAREVVEALEPGLPSESGPATEAPAVVGVAAGGLGTATALDEPTLALEVPPTSTFAAAEVPPAVDPRPGVVPSASPAAPASRRISPRAAGAIAAVMLLAIAGAALLDRAPGASTSAAGATPAATTAPRATLEPDVTPGRGGGNDGNGGGHGKGNGNGGGHGH